MRELKGDNKTNDKVEFHWEFSGITWGHIAEENRNVLT